MRRGSRGVKKGILGEDSIICSPGKALKASLWGLLLLAGLSIPSCHLNYPEQELRTQRTIVDRGVDLRSDIISRTAKVHCGFGTGSGSLIYENIFVTAYHVIADSVTLGTEIGLEFGSEEISWAWEIRVADRENDLAILSRPGTRSRGARLWMGVSDDYQAGDRVYCSGYPWGIGPVFTAGYLSKVMPDREYLIVSVNALPGSSGSGIYQMDGEFVGVLVRGIVNMGVWSQFIFHVIPLTRIEDKLRVLGIY